MKLSISKLVLGPLQNNVFLLIEQESREAVVIDPSYDPERLLQAVDQWQLKLIQIWITHAHADHTAGAAQISQAFTPNLPVAIHPDSLTWAQQNRNSEISPLFRPLLGEASAQRFSGLPRSGGMGPSLSKHNTSNFGFPTDPLSRNPLLLHDKQQLAFPSDPANPIAEVREVPGHCPGSIIFYVPLLNAAFVGDAIFCESIGRTDFVGGDYDLLIKSIKEQIFTLPDETVLLSGHGPETTVAFEKHNNFYLRG